MNNRTPSHHLHSSPNKKDKNTNKEHTDTKEKTKKEKETQSQKPTLEATRAQHFALSFLHQLKHLFCSLVFSWNMGGYCSAGVAENACTFVVLWPIEPQTPRTNQILGCRRETWSAKYGGGLGGASSLTPTTDQGCPTSPSEEKKVTYFFCDYYFFVFMFSIFCLEFFRKRVLLARKCVWEDLIFLKGGGLRLSHFIFRYFLMCVL